MKRSWMLHAAGGLAAAFLLLHLLGGRGCVGVLSGTQAGGLDSVLLGLAYALSWFSTVLLVPPLLLAGLVRLALARREARKRGRSAPA